MLFITSVYLLYFFFFSFLFAKPTPKKCLSIALLNAKKLCHGDDSSHLCEPYSSWSKAFIGSDVLVTENNVYFVQARKFNRMTNSPAMTNLAYFSLMEGFRQLRRLPRFKFHNEDLGTPSNSIRLNKKKICLALCIFGLCFTIFLAPERSAYLCGSSLTVLR